MRHISKQHATKSDSQYSPVQAVATAATNKKPEALASGG